MLKIQKQKKLISFFWVCFLILPGVVSVSAEEEVIYKDPRLLKGFAEETKPAQISGVYTYDPTGKTDPFKSFVMIHEEQQIERIKTQTYLETVDLSQLELIAIMTGPKGNWAMVRDSKGDGHVIQKGVKIGTKGGMVEKITEKEVIIREEYKDFRGNKQYKEVVKKIPAMI